MATVALTASDRTVPVTVLVDQEDADRIGKHRLSIGSHGYAQIWNGTTNVLLHRWLLGIPVGTRHRVIVDHINRDRLDCRRENLRLVTPSESNLNRTLAPRDLPRGVYATPNKRYRAKIKRHWRTTNLGTFDTAEEAAAAYQAASRAVDRPELLPDAA